MIWVENVRPIKERKHWRFIHVKSLDKAATIDAILFFIGHMINEVDYSLDSDGEYYTFMFRRSMTDSEFNKWIDALGLIKVRQCRNHYHYILKEES